MPEPLSEQIGKLEHRYGRPALTGCPSRVKLRRTQCEHMFSALPSNSDIARRIPHVSKLPRTEVASYSIISSAGEQAGIQRERLPHCLLGGNAMTIGWSLSVSSSELTLVNVLTDSMPVVVLRRGVPLRRPYSLKLVRGLLHSQFATLDLFCVGLQPSLVCEQRPQ